MWIILAANNARYEYFFGQALGEILQLGVDRPADSRQRQHGRGRRVHREVHYAHYSDNIGGDLYRYRLEGAGQPLASTAA